MKCERTKGRTNRNKKKTGGKRTKGKKKKKWPICYISFGMMQSCSVDTLSFSNDSILLILPFKNIHHIYDTHSRRTLGSKSKPFFFNSTKIFRHSKALQGLFSFIWICHRNHTILSTHTCPHNNTTTSPVLMPLSEILNVECCVVFYVFFVVVLGGRVLGGR